MSKFAWVTLTTNDAYSLGALVLAHSLKRVGTAHQLAVLVTPTVSEAMCNKLREVYNVVQQVNVLDSEDAANLALLARPELGITFTKLHAWRLVQFEKCVFLDSDTLVLQNADELFEREELSAAPDVSWPDCFNSGVFVYRPNLDTFATIVEFAKKNGSFDGGDQGLLNMFFSDWAHKDISKHLPFTYNTTAFATYSYLPAFKQFKDNIKILHFAGNLKPWLITLNPENKTAIVPHEFRHAANLIQLWWDIFCDDVHQSLSDQMSPWHKEEQHHENTQIDHGQTHESSYNKNDYSENLFDDIYPYHDPWEDYYEKLAKLNEENFNNNNNNNNNNNESFIDQQHQSQDTEKIDVNMNFSPITILPQISATPPIQTPAEGFHFHPHHHDQQKDHHEHYDDHHVHHDYHSDHHDHQYYHHDHHNDHHDHHNDHHGQHNDHRDHHSSHHDHHSGHHEHHMGHRDHHSDQHDHRSNQHDHHSHDQTQNEFLVQAPQPEECRFDNFSGQSRQSSKESSAEEHRIQNIDKGYISSTSGPVESVLENHGNNLSDRINLSHTTGDYTPQAYGEERQSLDRVSAEPDTLSKSNKFNFEAGLASALSQLRLGEPRSKEQEAYEESMRRQCWEAGNIDYLGKDSFDNIWKKITQTLESKSQESTDEHQLTSAEIEDGKVEYDPATKVRKQYKHIDGGYEVTTIIPQQNGTVKTQVQTFYDPKPVSDNDLVKQQKLSKTRKTQAKTKEVIRIDKNTTMTVRLIDGGYEEVYTTVYDDGSKSTRVQTFYDPVEVTEETTQQQQTKKKVNKLTRTNANDDQETNVTKQSNKLTKTNTEDEEEETNVTKKRVNKDLAVNQKTIRRVNTEDDEEINVRHETVEETRRVTKKTEVSGKKTIVRDDSTQEEHVKSVTKDKKKKTRKAPPPPADFIQNETTTVVSKKVPDGVEYTYSTTLESGKTITTSKTIYEEEEVEMTEEEIKLYKKQLKDAEKHKNVTTTKKLRSESGTKKVVPSENPGEVTTVETIQIEGGTEYHYTTVTAEGIVKKAVKTVYDPTLVQGNDESEEEEIVEEYEEEIIEPGEKVVKTFESTKTLPPKAGEIVEKKTPRTKSSKIARTDTEEEASHIIEKKDNELMEVNQQRSNVRKVQEEEHMTGKYNMRRESKVEEVRTMTQKIKISGSGKY